MRVLSLSGGGYQGLFTALNLMRLEEEAGPLSDSFDAFVGTSIGAIIAAADADGFVNAKYTLTPKLWDYLQNYAAKHKAAGNGFGYGLCGPESVARTLSARYGKDGSEILIDQPGGRPRRLTPRECARLMGFDRKGSNRPWQIPVSDSQAYKQFGNAVAPPVSIAIADAMSARIQEALALDGGAAD